MKIKHWQGYGTVTAVRIKDKDCELHVRVSGNHEWGLERKDDYDGYRWLYKRFKRNAPEYHEWRMSGGKMETRCSWDYAKNEEVCDYIFKKENY